MKSKSMSATAAEAKKMKAFLRAEGWKTPLNEWMWHDPKSIRRCGYAVAYRLAMKRKAARECRALKKAGFYYSGFSQKWFHVGLSFSNPIFVVGWPRSEALSKLATARRSRKDPIPNPNQGSHD